jgi:hypothetical protein
MLAAEKEVHYWIYRWLTAILRFLAGEDSHWFPIPNRWHRPSEFPRRKVWQNQRRNSRAGCGRLPVLCKRVFWDPVLKKANCYSVRITGPLPGGHEEHRILGRVKSLPRFRRKATNFCHSTRRYLIRWWHGKVLCRLWCYTSQHHLKRQVSSTFRREIRLNLQGTNEQGSKMGRKYRYVGNNMTMPTIRTLVTLGCVKCNC